MSNPPRKKNGGLIANQKENTSHKKAGFWVLILFVLFFLISFILSFSLGRYPIDPWTLIKILLSRILPLEQTWSSQMEIVVFNIRLPRVLAGSLIGASLALSGLVFQTIFHNPMVSPDVLGTTSGAGFGAALALLLNLPSLMVNAFAFIMGLISILLVYLVSSRVKNNQILGFVLGGIMISSIFTSLTSYIKLVADPNDTLPNITYFLMGSLASCTMRDVAISVIPMALGMTTILLLSWKLNLLSLSEEEARSLGINTRLIRTIVVIASALLISTSVAIAGVIGWIGLVIPHIIRMLIGCDTRRTIPASIFMGSSFLIIVDTFSRMLSTAEVPIGILTSLIGAPFFLYLIIRQGRREDAL